MSDVPELDQLTIDAELDGLNNVFLERGIALDCATAFHRRAQSVLEAIEKAPVKESSPYDWYGAVGVMLANLHPVLQAKAKRYERIATFYEQSAATMVDNYLIYLSEQD